MLSKCDDLRILSIFPVADYADNKLSNYETVHTGGLLWSHIALIQNFVLMNSVSTSVRARSCQPVGVTASRPRYESAFWIQHWNAKNAKTLSTFGPDTQVHGATLNKENKNVKCLTDITTVDLPSKAWRSLPCLWVKPDVARCHCCF